MKIKLSFPKNFVWGVATAAPQIEGAAFEDGKGESTWDHFARIPGKVLNGDNLDVACDHYHLYKQDAKLMQKLGIKNYRLSVAWPRIYPNGDGAVNPKGLDFYNRLVDTLLDHDITPWITLFHWDLPQALEDRGGWRTRLVPDAFGTYADTVVQTLGDRVKNWITLNEIICFTVLAHQTCAKAPGKKEPDQVVNQMTHHALLAHGQAVRAVREFGGKGARVGLTENQPSVIPFTDTPADVEAAKKIYLQKNGHILEPLYGGGYSANYLRRCGKDRPIAKKGDFDLISQKTDFLGLNLYTACFARAGKGGKAEEIPLSPLYPTTSCNWLKVVPQTLYWGTRFAHELFKPGSIYITENGCGYDDDTVVNGEVYDLHRRDFVRSYLCELQHAVAEGVPVKGYFLWSLMDNYEWEDGYTRRFGIVHNDFKTQKRTPKLSAKWYSQVIKENRIV